MKQYSEKVITAFLEGKTETEIAEKTGLGRRTVYRYRRDPELQKILQKRRADMVRETTRKLQAGLSEAVETLQSIIASPEVSPQVRVNACSVLFTQCRAMTELTDVIERLEALEEYQEGPTTAHNGPKRAGK